MTCLSFLADDGTLCYELNHSASISKIFVATMKTVNLDPKLAGFLDFDTSPSSVSKVKLSLSGTFKLESNKGHALYECSSQHSLPPSLIELN